MVEIIQISFSLHWKQIYSIDITISNLPLILNIETSTKNCSVALYKSNKLVSEKSLLSDKYSHSEKLNLFIENLIEESSFEFKDIDAISVSKGPGSYTGLRIGVSTAKGLCYALSIPLISVSTLRAMSYSMSQRKTGFDFYCPMIDARRMEVFSAFFDNDNNIVRKVQADIIDKNSYSQFLENKVLFFGDGSSKCIDLINSKNAFFEKDIFPKASDMALISLEKYNHKDFEDVAYFEPFYLKDFIVGRKNA